MGLSLVVNFAFFHLVEGEILNIEHITLYTTFFVVQPVCDMTFSNFLSNSLTHKLKRTYIHTYTDTNTHSLSLSNIPPVSLKSSNELTYNTHIHRHTLLSLSLSHTLSLSLSLCHTHTYTCQLSFYLIIFHHKKEYRCEA